MINALTLLNFDNKKSYPKAITNKVNRKSKTKIQARKNHTREAVEILWLKQFFTKKVSIVFLLLVSVFTIPFMLPTDDLFPIQKIKLSGVFKQLDSKVMESQLAPYLGNGFFSVDIRNVQFRLSQEPWIQTVSVKRIWPDQLHIHVKEKNAFARWDKSHLLSSQAEIFKADSEQFLKLPKITGYYGQTKDLLQKYRLMEQEFLTHGISINEMTEDNKGALRLVLNNELKVNIGSENNDQKIKHLLAVYHKQIKPRAIHIKHIDFRYNNGFAIAWKQDYLDQPEKKVKRGSKNV